MLNNVSLIKPIKSLVAPFSHCLRVVFDRIIFAVQHCGFTVLYYRATCSLNENLRRKMSFKCVIG